MDPYAGVVIQGHADTTGHPFPLDIDELEAERQRTREALDRKRPCGFAPWPDEQPGELRRVA